MFNGALKGVKEERIAQIGTREMDEEQLYPHYQRSTPKAQAVIDRVGKSYGLAKDGMNVHAIHVHILPLVSKTNAQVPAMKSKTRYAEGDVAS